jgi:AcrR family transcriptional regulator
MTEHLEQSPPTTDARGATRAPVQRRGQQRVDAILDAAEAVIAEVGVEAATVQAIADRSGASVGSLYHFFANKDAIVEGLAERYNHTVRETMERTRRADEPWVPLTELFPKMIADFVELERRHPGYMHVCRATDSASGGRSPIALRTQAALHDMVRDLLQRRNPKMPQAEALVHAQLSVAAVGAVLDQIGLMPTEEQPALAGALVDLLVRYFEPVEAQAR